ncbi:pyridoxamine kinase [Lactobacillus sp. LL6]|uniref:pyridoxamine kinase n=1 Tax=Lactobacillus sp. LL6 TaxID=2596827 RepID=UPI0011850D87|nr:pyridoxamine kinase [Lactobacillus sp. LL6]TSO25490.1 pyridoxamine kinase [Lactobacillus sp. LL6]
MKNILISQDLSCVGQVSSEVALPILAACGYQTNLLPTALLSTHTGGFGNNTYLDLSEEMKKITHHWHEAGINFSAVYLGYLGGQAIDFWLNELEIMDPKLVLIDPVMGDHGKLYKGMNENYVRKMRQLVTKATILTPNLTEAMYLLDKKVNLDNVDILLAKNVAIQVAERFGLSKVVITGIPLKNKIGIVGFDNGKTWEILEDKLPGSFFGTGDIFASSFLAEILADKNLKEAAQIAGKFVKIAIKNTSDSQDKRFGPNYAAGLNWLMENINDAK